MAYVATFFVPAIHEQPTGGNIYNRRVIERLRRRGSVDVCVYGTDDWRDFHAGSLNKRHTGLVDSLLLRDHDQFDHWARAVEVDRLVLLVHYLHLVDPSYDHGREAEREREYLDLFDGYVVTSWYVRERLIREGVPAADIRVLRPGLDSHFTEEVDRSSANERRILTVASFLPGKGLLEGVKTLEEVADFSWVWHVIGADELDREYSARLRRTVESSSVNDRINLVGPVESSEIVDRYDAAGLFFLPSSFETCSMVTMEAMSRGLPVVAYDVGGIRELVDDGVTGYLAERGAWHTAVGYLRALLEDDERRQRMGQAARKASSQFVTWKEVADRFEQLLEVDG